MKLLVSMVNGDSFEVENMPPGDVLEFVSEWREGSDQTLTLALDQDEGDEPVMAHLARRHISSVEVEDAA